MKSILQTVGLNTFERVANEAISKEVEKTFLLGRPVVCLVDGSVKELTQEEWNKLSTQSVDKSVRK